MLQLQVKELLTLKINVESQLQPRLLPRLDRGLKVSLLILRHHRYTHFLSESIRSALLFQAEELWTRAIECAVNLSESDDSSPAPLSSASKSSSTTSLAPLLLTDKLSSVNLVYFDRKLFFKSLTRMITALGLVALTIALLVGRKNKPQASPSPTSPNTTQSKNAAILEAQYLNYLQRKLHLDNSLPDELIHVSSQLTELDGRVSGMVRRMQSIKRFMHDDYQVFGEE